MGKLPWAWTDETGVSAPLLEQQDPDLIPRPPVQPVRVVGPGRRERAYQEEIVALGRRGAALSTSLRNVQGDLESALLIERGTARFTDRLEDRLSKVESQKSRALVLVGSLQQEVLQVRAQLERAQSRLARVEPARRGLLQRLLGSLVSPRA